MTSLRLPRSAALVAITVLVAAASLVSFAESYRGLYIWAHHHRLSGPWAVAWPLQIDTFIGVGELALFVALADRWATRSRVGAWLVTGLGLAVSVAANIGHVAGHDVAARATAAVPPLAAAAALAVGLGVLKRVVARSAQPVGLTDLLAEADRVSEIQPVTVVDVAAMSARPDAMQGNGPRGKRTSSRVPKAAKPSARVAAIVRRQPDISGAELGRKVGVSDRQGRRLLAQMNGSTV
jgi:hypothetical protein